MFSGTHGMSQPTDKHMHWKSALEAIPVNIKYEHHKQCIVKPYHSMKPLTQHAAEPMLGNHE
jgi:hypothetical protein